MSTGGTGYHSQGEKEWGVGREHSGKKNGLIRCDVHQAGSDEDSVVAYCLFLTLLSCQEGGPTSQCRCGHLLGTFIFCLSEELQDPAQR